MKDRASRRRAAVVSCAADRAGDVLCAMARDSVGDVADCRERDGCEVGRVEGEHLDGG